VDSSGMMGSGSFLSHLSLIIIVHHFLASINAHTLMPIFPPNCELQFCCVMLHAKFTVLSQ
jgi:hypothetical protein